MAERELSWWEMHKCPHVCIYTERELRIDTVIETVKGNVWNDYSLYLFLGFL